MKNAARLRSRSLLLLALACPLACKSSDEVRGPQASAAPVSAAPEGAVPSVRPEAARLRADVEWLADDAREGRRAGTQGERDSARFLAARLEQLGLEPAGEEGWFQNFEVELPPRDGGGSFLTWQASDGEQRAHGPARLTPLFCSASAEVSGELVFAGYGIANEERGWDDFAGLELEGKLALIVRGTPPAPGEDARAREGALDEEQLDARHASWGNSGGIFHKVMAAKHHGAIAVVLAQDPARGAQPPLVFDAGRTAHAGIPAVMLADELARELYDPRRLAQPAGASPARPSPSVRVSADIVRERAQASNVLGRLPGRDRARTVVVGAHYDHLGRGGAGSLGSDSLGEIHNGADDNASGTAVVLEIARCLAAAPAPEGDVVFALWSGEELGLVGSQHWAEQPTFALDSVRANLNLDMVGRAGDGQLQVLGAGTAAPFAAWLDEADANSELALTVSTSTQGLGGSDHQTFLEREIPALHLFSGVHIDYHKPSDDAELFESEGAAEVAALAIELVARMQSARELAYVVPVAGEGGPAIKTGFSVWFGSVPAYAYEGQGLLMDGVSRGSPAEAAGLLAGDVIVRLGSVEVASISDFMYALQAHKPGDVLRTTYLREGERRTTLVTLRSRDAP